jgi:4-amino-4-deoxy-L-arabinose transferase-like glycosyltransferase
VTEARGRVLAVGLCIALIWLSFAGYRDLVHPDVGRYAEIPREMVESGDWVTPRLDGFKYFEKPPLQYWGTAVAFEVFGENNATARVWPIGLGLLAVLWTFLLGRRLFGAEAGAFAAILLASSFLWFTLGTCSRSTRVSALLALSLGAMAWAQTHRVDPARVRRWMLLAWAALAAATLSKGPVALVLTGGTVVAYSFWQRDFALWKHLHLGWGLSVLFAIAAPWFVVVGLRNPGFTSFFFLHENFARYTSDIHERVQPWWTYVPVVVLGATPWMRPGMMGLARPVRVEARAGGSIRRALWVWCRSPCLLLGRALEAHPHVQPIFPALVPLAARRLRASSGFSFEAGVSIALGLGSRRSLSSRNWVTSE